MLHDIGKTLLLEAVEEMERQGELAGADPAWLLEPLLEGSHVELGALMAEEWKLPAFVIQVCRQHHAEKFDATEPRELNQVRVMSALAEMRLNPRWQLRCFEEAQRAAGVLALNRHQLRAASTQVRDLAAKADLLMKEVPPR
jgi:HD-like signal output (HDOD) protein